MKRILLLCFCFATLHLQSQIDVEYFTSGSIYSGITNKVINLNNYYILDDIALIDLYFPSQPYRVKNESMLGMAFQAGLILKEKWYLSAGFRYDTRKFSTCYYCHFRDPVLRNAEQAIQSRALEVPISIQYRVVPDLPVSPILHAESFLAFRENSETGYYYSSTNKQQMLGYRLGVGLNYQLNKVIELNLLGTWGRAKSLSGVSLFNWTDDHHYNGFKITDYQLSFGLISKLGS